MEENLFYVDHPICNYSFFNVINTYFESWPFRDGAFDIEHYFERIDDSIDIFDLDKCEHILLFYDFIINFIDWLGDDYETYPNVTDEELASNKNNFQIILSTIDYQLERMNYKKIKGKEHYYITKRNSDIDCVLSSIHDPSISELLLSYIDFRIEKSIPAKKGILVQLNAFIELHKDTYRNTDIQLYKDISCIMNNAGIRHKESMEPKLNRKEQFYWFDSCFTMILHLIRKSEIDIIQKKMNDDFKPRCNKA